MFECKYCFKSFATTKARKQHVAAKHLTFSCSLCDKAFRTEVDLNNHNQAKHDYADTDSSDTDSYDTDDEVDAPVEDAEGKWVSREKFPHEKSFSKYKCSCGNTWTSAHGFKKHWQECKSCYRRQKPTLMWLNYSTSHTKQSHGKGHHIECGACLAGKCIRST